ncbi:hypothetical protein BXO88_10680 [Oribacterium sp. C9]|uniref:hypothetical protein n=1 Tax=Oribacterium sp. C9 TaxID=1943579 RepID=UPI00098FBEA9|nr:hypothetical protein [Oribacterium sp. C9]OON85716.1 hypothetical protein BXO88_10680 [Oribacterium sp. C9]
MVRPRILEIIPPAIEKPTLITNRFLSTQSERAILLAISNTLTKTRISSFVCDFRCLDSDGYHIIISKIEMLSTWYLTVSDKVLVQRYNCSRSDVLEICMEAIECISHSNDEKVALLELFRDELLKAGNIILSEDEEDLTENNDGS